MAVHCLECRRPLRDPESIKRQRGPICFVKAGGVLVKGRTRAAKKSGRKGRRLSQMPLPFFKEYTMPRRNIPLAVELAMTNAEKEAFLAAFTKINPHWRGAKVADVLDELANRDAHLAIIEPLVEEHGDEITTPGLFTTVTLAVIYINSEARADWPQVKELADRVTASQKIA